ncbi:MAG: ABC transporter ATP-binding protein [Clostridiaceae bacterium]
MNDVVIKIEDLYKQYRLGVIGGDTLQADLQSWWAKVRGKEDPNIKIGTKNHNKNETFMALNGINLEVHKGDTLGIIGRNGAGKSTMLKVLSRVTAPTKGRIYINGRISSMLEVGTGFNGELTGRENVYLNGAILGMSKAEVDSKIEQIIDFSEVRQFIDTPVKRYSSGMYVKLAFAVAAHLDSEILVMDEVLAVGDMKFQQKCLGKMGDAANNEGRTVLYVSHNMNTIRQLCNRCIVINKGRIIYNGDVEEAIQIYSENNNIEKKIHNQIINNISEIQHLKAKILSTTILNTEDATYYTDEKMQFMFELYSNFDINNIHARVIILSKEEIPVGITFTDEFSCKIGINKNKFEFDMTGLAPGLYSSRIILSLVNEFATVERIDIVEKAMTFEIVPKDGYCYNIPWLSKSWGYHKYLNAKSID